VPILGGQSWMSGKGVYDYYSFFRILSFMCIYVFGECPINIPRIPGIRQESIADDPALTGDGHGFPNNAHCTTCCGMLALHIAQ